MLDERALKIAGNAIVMLKECVDWESEEYDVAYLGTELYLNEDEIKQLQEYMSGNYDIPVGS